MVAVLTNDPLTRLAFSIYENPGVYALLIGSGLSRAAGILTGWGITLDLIRQAAMMEGEKEQDDWAAWYRKKTGKEPDYKELMGKLGSSRAERRSILHSYIEPTEDDQEENRKIPTAAHHAIADLVQLGYVRVIVTTNFDRLLENAMSKQGVEPTVVASPDALKGAEPLTHSKCYLLKLHGDYKDARILNTEEELSKYPPKYIKLLDRIFDEHGLVVCGWSGEWDHALKTAILRSPNRRYSMFWAARGECGADAEEIIAHRKGNRIGITDADSFLVEIRDRIKALARTPRQNPQSIELLVNSTKRYLSKPEYRIQLDELLTSESGSLMEKLEATDFSADKDWSADEFQRRVEVYEAATEPLARMVGVLARWGDGSKVDMMLDIVRFARANAIEPRGGKTLWIELLSYPTVLLVTAYGIGLVHSQRWHALHRFLSSEIEDRRSEMPKRIVETLFLQAWEGGRHHWDALKGMENHKFPLSDHLFDLFKEWSKSYVGVAPSFEQLYDTWEIMGSLIYSERYTLSNYQETISQNIRHGDLCSVPTGRSGWNARTCDQIIRRIQKNDLKQKLLKAGFGNGQSDLFEAAIKNFHRVVRGSTPILRTPQKSSIIG